MTETKMDSDISGSYIIDPVSPYHPEFTSKHQGLKFHFFHWSSRIDMAGCLGTDLVKGLLDRIPVT